MKIGNRPELYKKTVDILYRAYFNDTLEHADCHACTVGNLVVANMGLTLSPCGRFWLNKRGKLVQADWFAAIGNGQFLKERLSKGAINQIKSTGYTGEELAAIEYAFETCQIPDSFNQSGDFKDPQFMFNGLVAVLNILAEIHDVQEDLESFPRFDDVYTTKRMKV